MYLRIHSFAVLKSKVRIIGGCMAIKWNILTGRNKKRAKMTIPVKSKEPVKETVKETEDKGITPEEIKNLVDREVNAASMKNQMVNYFNNIEAQGIRTEAILEELKIAVDASLNKIQDAANKDFENSQRILEINAAVGRVEKISRGLEESIHKDNLLTYTNLKELIEQTDRKNEKRLKKLKAGIIVGIIFSILSVAGIAFSILMQLDIIAF